MRRAAIVVVAALMVMLIGDLVFARLVERAAAGELERRTGAATAAVDVRSFPLVESLFRRGEVREVTVRLEDVVSNGLPLVEVTLTGVDVGVDRTDAAEGDLRITVSGRADIVVEISEDDLSEVFGVEVDLEIDRLTLSIDGEPTPLGAAGRRGPRVDARGRGRPLDAAASRRGLPPLRADARSCSTIDWRCSARPTGLPNAFGGIAVGSVTQDELDEVGLVEPRTEDRSDSDIPDRLGRAEGDDSDE